MKVEPTACILYVSLLDTTPVYIALADALYTTYLTLFYTWIFALMPTKRSKGT